MSKGMRLFRNVMIALVAICVLAFGGFYIYTLDYYRAFDEVDSYGMERGVSVYQENRVYTVQDDENHGDIGIVFYPGGKVEAKAYLPLLVQLAEKGVTSVMVEMPFNLAILDTDGAEMALEAHPEISEWYIMGHSLGGASASLYLDKAHPKYEGLILLGAYPLNEAPTKSLAIYGTYDIMLDLEKVAAADMVYEIVGGNHAQFGNYGPQEGDGEAEISREEQQAQTVLQIMTFIGE